MSTILMSPLSRGDTLILFQPPSRRHMESWKSTMPLRNGQQ